MGDYNLCIELYSLYKTRLLLPYLTFALTSSIFYLIILLYCCLTLTGLVSFWIFSTTFNILIIPPIDLLDFLLIFISLEPFLADFNSNSMELLELLDYDLLKEEGFSFFSISGQIVIFLVFHLSHSTFSHGTALTSSYTSR